MYDSNAGVGSELEVRTVVRINVRTRAGGKAPLYIDPETGDVFRRLKHFRLLNFDPEFGDHLDKLRQDAEERELALYEGEGAGPPLGVFLDGYEEQSGSVEETTNE